MKQKQFGDNAMKGRDLRGSLRRRLEGVADEDCRLPFFEKCRAEVVVKLDGRFVPVQNFPAHAEIFFAPGDSGNVLDQSCADAVLAKRGPHKNVVQKQSGASLKRRVKIKKDGVPNRF